MTDRLLPRKICSMTDTTNTSLTQIQVCTIFFMCVNFLLSKAEQKTLTNAKFVLKFYLYSNNNFTTQVNTDRTQDSIWFDSFIARLCSSFEGTQTIAIYSIILFNVLNSFVFWLCLQFTMNYTSKFIYTLISCARLQTIHRCLPLVLSSFSFQ